MHLTVLPLSSEQEQIAVVLLVHDLSFLDRREAASRRFLLPSRHCWRFLLRCSPSRRRGAVAGVDRFASRPACWDSRRCRVCSGGADVRELVGQLLRARTRRARREMESSCLKQILTDVLHGEQVLPMANRESYIHNRTESGPDQVLHPASGLVTALEPVMRACSGVWIAHGSGSADRETADAKGRLSVPLNRQPIG